MTLRERLPIPRISNMKQMF